MVGRGDIAVLLHPVDQPREPGVHGTARGAALASGRARTAARVIRQQLRAHVAWLPLANTFQLGDFGVISGGIFTRLGNVRSLGVKFGTRRSDGPPFEFRSGGVTEVDPRLCADEVKSGQLVAPFDISIMTGRTYTLVCRPDETDLARIAAFRDWALTALVESNIPEVLEPKPA